MLSLSRWTLLIIPCLWSGLSSAETNSVDEVESVRANLARSLEYADQAAKEQFAWELRREEMENLILLAEEEKRNLEAVIAMARPILADLQSRKADLAVDEDESKLFADFLRSAGPDLAEKLLEKSKYWPDPLLLEVRDPLHEIRSTLGQRIDLASGKNSGKLIQSIVEALEAALEFQNTIHRAFTLKTLPDGREALFEVVFIGLGGGYYISNELKLAGRIVPRSGDWKWIPQDDLIEPVRAFIEIVKEERPATWVQLPVGNTTKEASL